MKILSLRDFITAFIFGVIIFCCILVFQKSTSHPTSKIAKTPHKKSTTSNLSISNQKEQTQEFSSKSQESPTTLFSPNTESDTALAEETTTELNDDEVINENYNDQRQDISEIMNQKIVNFITNDLNLSLSFSDRVINAQTNLKMQLYANDRLLEETGVSPEAQVENQKAFAEYQNELVQVLGPDGFKKFSEWKQQAKAELIESYPGNQRDLEYL